MIKPNSLRSLVNILLLQKRREFEMSIDLFSEIIRPLSMKRMIEMGMLRFFRCFSKIYRKEEK